VLTGQSHYTTFDGRNFDFTGQCEYVLVQQAQGTHSDHPFSVWVENKLCDNKQNGICSKAVTLQVGKETFAKVFRFLPREVYLNDVSIKVPYKQDGIVIRYVSSTTIQVSTTFGVSLLITQSNIEVQISSKLREQVTGMCGNFNGNTDDDYLTVEGDNIKDVVKFVESWKTSAECQSKSTIASSCSQNTKSFQFAKEQCAILSSEVFSRCYSLVDPALYISMCEQDMCACSSRTDGTTNCQCAVLAAYARECAIAGEVLDNWRANGKCAVSCTGGQVYQECAKASGQTCGQVQPDVEADECFAGCNCPAGQAIDEETQKCVPVADCKCAFKGNYYKNGATREDQCNTCTCESGFWKCTQHDCMAHQMCPADKVWNHCADCQPTCANMHLACPASRCRSAGCTCIPGMVLNTVTGKCVKPAECPCSFQGRTLTEGTIVPLECNTCKCTSGRMVCTNATCGATCSAFGDRHYVTFDGKSFEFKGACSYVLAEDGCNDKEKQTFKITAENVPCGAEGMVCTKSVVFQILNTVFHLVRGTAPIVKHVEASQKAVYEIVDAGAYTIIKTKHGINIQWDRSMRVYITLEPRYRNQVCGMCGNFDSRADNDFRARTGQIETNAVSFANTWRTKESCPWATPIESPCKMNPEREYWAKGACSVLMGSIFSECHSAVDYRSYVDKCVVDSCSCSRGADCESLCTALAAYAHPVTPKASTCAGEHQKLAQWLARTV